MSVFENAAFRGHEHVSFHHDPATGLKAIIAIHDTTLGPALGGCRMWAYASEAEAVTDALRLSQGMTYKSALAGLKFGGGKSVIIGNAKADKSPELMRAMGSAVERLGGRYIVAEDVGVGTADVTEMATRTSHVAGLPGQGGDPSPATAYGVYMGIRAAVAFRQRRNSLDGVRVAVQGLGNVGRNLCGYLAEDGADLTVADINPDAVSQAVSSFGARTTSADRIHAADVDVYAPCALGAVINDTTVDEIRATVVAGSANNQLSEARHGAELARRGILYAPDYVINAGGIINIAHEPWHTGKPYDRGAALRQVADIHDTLLEIFAAARDRDETTADAADQLAEQRLAA